MTRLGAELPPPYLFTLTINVGGPSVTTPAELAQLLRNLADDMDNRTAGNPSEPITMATTTTIGGNTRNRYGETLGHWSIRP